MRGASAAPATGRSPSPERVIRRRSRRFATQGISARSRAFSIAWTRFGRRPASRRRRATWVFDRVGRDAEAAAPAPCSIRPSRQRLDDLAARAGQMPSERIGRVVAHELGAGRRAASASSPAQMPSATKPMASSSDVELGRERRGSDSDIRATASAAAASASGERVERGSVRHMGREAARIAARTRARRGDVRRRQLGTASGAPIYRDLSAVSFDAAIACDATTHARVSGPPRLRGSPIRSRRMNASMTLAPIAIAPGVSRRTDHGMTTAGNAVRISPGSHRATSGCRLPSDDADDRSPVMQSRYGIPCASRRYASVRCGRRYCR